MRRPGAQKYFYLYQITNLVNGKIYIGVHATYNLNDGYMGSGKRIRAAIAKYGLDNFKKIILGYYPTLAAVLSAEKEIVTADFCARADTYNIAVGGKCGGSLMAGKTPEELALWRQHISDVRKVQAQDPEYRENYKKIRNSPEFLRKSAETRSKNEKEMTRDQRAARSTLFKKAHADPEVRGRHSIAARKWWAGLPPEERQSRRRVWYTDGASNFLIKENDVPAEGWVRGRSSLKHPMYVYIIDGLPFYSEKEVMKHLNVSGSYATWRVRNKEWLHSIRKCLNGGPDE